MPRPRFDNLPDQSGALLLDSAVREFATQGFAGASLNRILSSAGYTKGSYHYYFEDKEDLFMTAVDGARSNEF